MWLAGGGVRGGMAYGATDDFGFKAVENVMHVHDLHATILHLMGFDHEKLTFRHAGRDFRLTDVHGHVVHDIIRYWGGDAPVPFLAYCDPSWGRSSVGRAPHWQCGGQEFESPRLHQNLAQ